MARYTVGEEVLFINVKFTTEGLRLSPLYLPWKDKLEKIDIIKLTCKEHHRIPGDWDDEIQHDGFIFTGEVDGVERTYNNQYPRASYGQLDDSNNWRISDFTEDGDIVTYTDAGRMLSNINNGVRELKKSEPEYAKALQVHFDELVEMINKAGFDAKEEPVVFHKKDGGTESFPDVTHVVVTKKQ